MHRVAVVALVVLVCACGKHAADEPPRPALDRAALYPLIVPANDLPTGPVRRPLVEGLVVALADAQPIGQQAKLLREPDLQGLSLDEAYTLALANLEAAAERGDIHVNGELGSDGRTLDVVWSHDWRAAACLLLPGVRKQAAQKLAAEAVYAAVPDRDLLVLFADSTLGAAALAADKGAPSPITKRLLRVVPGDQPFWVRSPVAWATSD